MEDLSTFVEDVQGSKPMGWAHHVSFITEKAKDSYFLSYDTEKSWISLTFEQKVKVCSYQLMCPSAFGGVGYLRNWILLASNDEDDWILIDERRGCDSLQSEEPVLFKCFSDQSFKHVRLCQTDVNSAGTNILALSYFNVLGMIDSQV